MDREVTVNRPEIIIERKNEKTCILIDLATPAGRNVTQKEADEWEKNTGVYIQRHNECGNLGASSYR
jgi:hypothetical protein